MQQGRLGEPARFSATPHWAEDAEASRQLEAEVESPLPVVHREGPGPAALSGLAVRSPSSGRAVRRSFGGRQRGVRSGAMRR